MILCKINGNLSVGMRLITTEASRRPLAILKPLMLVDMAEPRVVYVLFPFIIFFFFCMYSPTQKRQVRGRGREHAYECVLLMSCRHGI